MDSTDNKKKKSRWTKWRDLKKRVLRRKGREEERCLCPDHKKLRLEIDETSCGAHNEPKCQHLEQEAVNLPHCSKMFQMQCQNKSESDDNELVCGGELEERPEPGAECGHGATGVNVIISQNEEPDKDDDLSTSDFSCEFEVDEWPEPVAECGHDATGVNVIISQSEEPDKDDDLSTSDLSCEFEVAMLEEGPEDEADHQDHDDDEESNGPPDAENEDDFHDNDIGLNDIGNNVNQHGLAGPLDPDDPDNPGDPDDPDDPGEPNNNNQDDPNMEDENDFDFDDPSLGIFIQIMQQITVREVCVLVLTLGIRFSLSYICIIEIFKMLNVVLGRKYFPASKDRLWAVLGRTNAGIKKHFYCPKCLRMIENFEQQPARFRCECSFWITKKSKGVFLQMSLSKQLKYLLQRPGFHEELQYGQQRQKQVAENIEDILDGSFYQSLQGPDEILSNVNNLSYVFNTDGFRTAKSSNVEAWPLFIRLNELPPILRQKYVLLAGIWVDKKHPNMNAFLAPFVEEANQLSSRGVSWVLNGEERRTLFAPVCCTADAKGRCAILNFNEPTGYCACQFCTHQGVRAGGATKYPMWPSEDFPALPEPLPRTKDSICDDMIHANNGFKGASELMLLDHFDLKESFSTDDLHPIFLGVLKDYFTELFDFGNICYIGDAATLAAINRLLMSLKTPTSLSRKPRPMQTWKKWKGTEFRNFLWYYLPCLQGILPERFLRHLYRLANATHLLSQESISQADLVQAEDDLITFCHEYEDLFGVEKMKFNVHMLLHLVEVVRKLGNLWAHSTFNFESWNHRLGKFVTSSNAACDQITNRLLMTMFVSCAPFDDRISRRVQDHVDSVLSGTRLDNAWELGGVYFLGKAVRRAPTVLERRVLQQHGFPFANVVEYKRAFHKNIELRSDAYDNEDKRLDNSNFITWGGVYAHVVSILIVRNAVGEQVCGMICKIYDSTPDDIAPFIVEINRDEIAHDWEIFQNVRSLAVKIDSENGCYLARIPNHIDID